MRAFRTPRAAICSTPSCMERVNVPPQWYIPIVAVTDSPEHSTKAQGNTASTICFLEYINYGKKGAVVVVYTRTAPKLLLPCCRDRDLLNMFCPLCFKRQGDALRQPVIESSSEMANL